jgi:hypothetical protein
MLSGEIWGRAKEGLFEFPNVFNFETGANGFPVFVSTGCELAFAQFGHSNTVQQLVFA